MSVSAEQSVIGALLIDPNSFNDISDYLAVEDFTDPNLKIAYREILSMVTDNLPIDMFLLKDRASVELDYGYLSDIQKNTASSANIKHYAEAMKKSAIAKSLISAAREIEEIAQGRADISEMIDNAQSIIGRIQHDNQNDSARNITELLTEAIDELDRRFQLDGALIGLSSGFIDIDKILCGLKKTDLIIIAGRPSMGKTTLAMNIAFNVAIEKNKVLVFSLEMPASQLTDRALASVGNLPQDHIATGKMADDDWPRLTMAVGKIKKSFMRIDDTGGLTVTEIRNRARKIQREDGLDLLIIDYLQLIDGTGNNRNEQISMITRKLKSLAKELKVPVIVLSQLNRSLESRQNKRPVMSDLRESGAIEQDADVIGFLYRDEVYNPESPCIGIAEFIIAKHRNGKTGTIHLAFRGSVCRFDNFAGQVPVAEKKTKKWTKGFEY